MKPGVGWLFLLKHGILSSHSLFLLLEAEDGPLNPFFVCPMAWDSGIHSPRFLVWVNTGRRKAGSTESLMFVFVITVQKRSRFQMLW